ncbi:SIR2 family protein [Desulfovibrio sp. JC022]|uniref:SIR2 family NAD-dependent protein deacylase n=1 Tax=Desulfovibrio sp. JC022 TaxID=2593642 RepID=UPI0013D4182E|nr:SIR2 family protein [Desulfovibrio sp. JC022]NDV22265.1 SIR2 family protein [Desulfovibrio sp. JC022]
MQDQIHIQKIKEALEKRHASVMIGSGFSRNAINGDKMPTWGELVENLIDGLYPEKEQDEAYKRACAVSGILRIAEEYEAAHGRTALENIIKKSVPDDIVHPSDAHERLLSLSWNEVFTTNYDTLLERTAAQLYKNNYEIVSCIEDIPRSRRELCQRIIKLHGTFPSIRPFVITEEDYRTYPDKGAPFVNFVQQSMLENIFCLIGFSGDDPNFLAWTGWVRDRLQKHAPKLYFIHDRPLSQAQKTLFQQRNITPVNIDYEEEYRKDNYIRFISELERSLEKQPKKWPFQRPSSNTHPVNINGLKKHLTLWISNRKNYPGWIVAPARNRGPLLHLTNEWILFICGQIKDNENPNPILIAAFSELCWNLDISLTPFDDKLASTAKTILENTILEDYAPEHLGEFEPIIGHKQITKYLHSALTQIKLSLLQYYREESDEKFEGLLQDVTALSLPRDDRAFTKHQEILYHLQLLNLSEARSICMDWNTDRGDPFWNIIKAELLGELGEIKTALKAAHKGLNKIRSIGKVVDTQPANLSREAWATYHVQRLERINKHLEATQPSQSANTSRKEQWSERLEELKVIYSPDDELNILESQISERMRLYPDHEVSRHHFDLFDERQSNTLSSYRLWGDLRPAVQYVRLAEKVSCTPAIRISWINSTQTASTLLTVAKSLQRNGFIHRHTGLCIRVGTSEVLKPESPYFSRYSVALIPENYADRIFTSISKFMTEILESDTNDCKIIHNTQRFEFSLELLSRVALRITTGLYGDAANLLKKLWKNENIKNNWQIYSTFSRFAERVLEIIPDEEIDEIVIEQLSSNMEDIPTGDFATRYPEVTYVVPSTYTPNRDREEWSSLFSKLCNEFDAEDQHINMIILYRIQWLNNKKITTEENKQEFEDIFFTGAEDSAIPKIVGLGYPSSTLLKLPLQNINEKKELLKKFLLRDDVAASTNAFLSGVIRPGTELSWTLEEAETIVAKLGEWWDNSLKGQINALTSEQPSFIHDPKDQLRIDLSHIQIVLTEIICGQISHFAEQNKLIEWLTDIIDTCDEKELFPLRLMLLRCHLDTSYKDDAYEWLEAGILSNNETAAKEAVKAIILYCTSDWTQQDCPRQLREDLLSIITMLRLPHLKYCMDELTYALQDNKFSLSANEANRIINALKVLVQSTPYLEINVSLMIPKEEIPDYHYRAVKLLNLVSPQANDRAQENITKLQTILREAPLPEVRQLFN